MTLDNSTLADTDLYFTAYNFNILSCHYSWLKKSVTLKKKCTKTKMLYHFTPTILFFRFDLSGRVHLCLFALPDRDIEKGTELRYSYLDKGKELPWRNVSFLIWFIFYFET